MIEIHCIMALILMTTIIITKTTAFIIKIREDIILSWNKRGKKFNLKSISFISLEFPCFIWGILSIYKAQHSHLKSFYVNYVWGLDNKWVMCGWCNMLWRDISYPSKRQNVLKYDINGSKWNAVAECYCYTNDFHRVKLLT